MYLRCVGSHTHTHTLTHTRTHSHTHTQVCLKNEKRVYKASHNEVVLSNGLVKGTHTLAHTLHHEDGMEIE